MKFTPLFIIAGLAVMASCNGKDHQEKVPTEDEVILHAWSWSFDTIASNMKDIASAGYGFVQTSPAQTCYIGDGGGMALYSEEGDSVMGKWYYYYQPTDWKVGNYMLGNRESFAAMCDSAKKYGVRIIVDVLPNHTAFDTTAVTKEFNAAVGGHEKLYHSNGLQPVEDYNDRLQCTLMASGGLPDVNTENPAFQKYYMQYVNDLLALGASGFRYDTAKHIGLPSDPVDSLTAEKNNFWEVALGRESVDGVSLAVPADSLFIYGEVLQDRNVKEEEYAEYMGLVASSYGHALRNVLEQGNANAENLNDWRHSASPDQLVTWVESHDTYCNAHESAGLTDEQVRTGFVFLTARQHGTPLFFSRPAGSTRENYWGNNRIGARGNDEFKNPEIVAANMFRKRMSGEPETLYTSDNGAVVEVARGDKGAAIVNFSNMNVEVSLGTTLPNGIYSDAVYNQEFKVSNGTLTGELSPNASYILYAK